MKRSMISLCAAVMIAAGAPAFGQSLKVAKAFDTDNKTGEYVPLGPRYVLVSGRRFLGQAKAGLAENVSYTILDVEKKETIELQLPFGAFVESFSALWFGRASTGSDPRTKQAIAVLDADLVSYDPEHGRAGLIVKNSRLGGTSIVRNVYAVWDLKKQWFTWARPIADTDDRRLLVPVGTDPSGQHFYYALFRYTEPGSGIVSRLELSRIKLDGFEDRWAHTIELPQQRGATVSTYAVFPSPDFSRFIYPEYSEGSGRHKPADAYVIESATKRHFTVPIPVTPYGVAWDREGRSFAIGSNQTGQIVRIDVASKKQVGTAKGPTQITKMVISPHAKWLYVFARSKPIAVFSWPDLKPAKSIPLAALFPGRKSYVFEWSTFTPDGSAAIFSKNVNDDIGYLDLAAPGFSMALVGD
jgi:hypothetical protein